MIAGTGVMNSQRTTVIKPAQITYKQDDPARTGAGAGEASPVRPEASVGKKSRVRESSDSRASLKGSVIRSGSRKNEALLAGAGSGAIVTKESLPYMQEYLDEYQHDGARAGSSRGHEPAEDQRQSARKKQATEAPNEKAEYRDHPRHRST